MCKRFIRRNASEGKWQRSWWRSLETEKACPPFPPHPTAVQENKLRREEVSYFLNFSAVLRKFQPGLWAVLELKSSCRGGQHLTGRGLLIIPATLRHWLGAAREASLHENVLIDFTAQQLVCGSMKSNLRHICAWPPQASICTAQTHISS